MSVAVNTADDMPRATGPVAQPVPPPARLSERHFPGKLTDTAHAKPWQTNCIVSSGKKGRGRRTTTYNYKQCDVPMCVVPCFELYHTKIDPERYVLMRCGIYMA